jgi:hypothetical protein
MTWITISEDQVVTKLSGPEAAALKAAALKTDQEDPLPAVIEQVVREVRGYVAACERNKLGAGSTIPDELQGAAISRIRFELATRLPVASLLTDDRRRANEQALTLLRDVAACRFAIVAPVEVTDEQLSTPSPRWKARRRKFSQHHQDGA